MAAPATLYAHREGYIMLSYKIDILPALKAMGYTTTKLRAEKLIAEATIQNIRGKKPISWANIDKLCELLQCQPGDILEYVDGEAQ